MLFCVLFHSCIFMSCKLVRHFHVQHFQRPHRTYIDLIPFLHSQFCKYSPLLVLLLHQMATFDYMLVYTMAVKLFSDWLNLQESWATAKMIARCALYMGALKIFESSWVRPRLLLDRSCECAYKIWSSYLPIPEIGSTQKIGHSLDTLTLHFLPNF